ncbi:hypothetical protein D3C71_2070080 [compost metagenome]
MFRGTDYEDGLRFIPVQVSVGHIPSEIPVKFIIAYIIPEREREHLMNKVSHVRLLPFTRSLD